MGLWINEQICGFYNAKMWIKERLAKLSNNNPQFSMCCENGKILLWSLPATSQELEVLLTNKKRSAVKFQDQIHMYNSVLAFTSLGAKVDESVTKGIGPYSFRIQGELYHKIRSMCIAEGQHHNLHSCTFMIWRANVKTAMSLCHCLIQRH